jgi:hypothetical protein
VTYFIHLHIVVSGGVRPFQSYSMPTASLPSENGLETSAIRLRKICTPSYVVGMFNHRNNFTFTLALSSQLTSKDKEWVLLREAVAAATSVGHLAADQCQVQERQLLEAVGASDEDVVAVSWNWARKVRPSQTDHDREEVNNGEGLHTTRLRGLRYTARQRNCLLIRTATLQGSRVSLQGC